MRDNEDNSDAYRSQAWLDEHACPTCRAYDDVALKDRMLELACVELARNSKEWHEQRDSYDTGYNAAYFLADQRDRAEED